MSVYNERRSRPKLEKIKADTQFKDNRGDICTDPTHKHSVEQPGVEWHHGISKPESGGYFTYHLSFPYPEKGWKNDYVVQANNVPKRILMGWVRFLSYKWLLPFYFLFLLLPKPWKIMILNKFLKELVDTWHFFFDNNGYKSRWPEYLDFKLYSPISKALKALIEQFLIELGIDKETSERVGFYVATLIEYDRAYYRRIGDLFLTTSKELILLNPAKEIKGLVKTLSEREKRPHLVEKFSNLASILVLAFRIPYVKRAFIKSFRQINFEDLQLDEADKWEVRNMGGYDFFGRTLEDRLKEWPRLQHTLIEVDYSKLDDSQLDKLFL